MKGIVNTKRDPLRMHATAFLDARVIARIPKDTIVDIDNIEGGWMEVNYKGKTGWVDRSFITQLQEPKPDVYIDNAIRNGWLLVVGAIIFFIVFGLSLIGWIS